MSSSTLKSVGCGESGKKALSTPGIFGTPEQSIRLQIKILDAAARVVLIPNACILVESDNLISHRCSELHLPSSGMGGLARMETSEGIALSLAKRHLHN